MESIRNQLEVTTISVPFDRNETAIFQLFKTTFIT